MSDHYQSRVRYDEAFWRAHHEAWCRSELNQGEYCEAYGIPLKAFGNWRAKFKAEPQPLARKVLYRRGSLSHALGHGLSHDLPGSGPIVPPAREGRRRRFLSEKLSAYPGSPVWKASSMILKSECFRSTTLGPRMCCGFVAMSYHR